MMVRQLEEELRLRNRESALGNHKQMEALISENEHLTREVAILRETIKVSKQTHIHLQRYERLKNLFEYHTIKIHCSRLWARNTRLKNKKS